MFELRCAQLRSSARVLARAAVIGITLAMTACASDEEYRREAYGDQYAYADPRSRYGTVRPQGQDGQPAQRKADVEDDGLPSQTPPLKSRRTEPDDPREPFSPNYGSPAGTPRPAAPAPDQTPRQVTAPGRAPSVASWSYRQPR